MRDEQLARLAELRLSAEREAEPFVRLVLRASSLARPSYMLKDGQLEMIDDGIDPASRSLIAECKAMIASIYARAYEAWSEGPGRPATKEIDRG
jgi:hypothetical protein